MTTIAHPTNTLRHNWQLILAVLAAGAALLAIAVLIFSLMSGSNASTIAPSSSIVTRTADVGVPSHIRDLETRAAVSPSVNSVIVVPAHVRNLEARSATGTDATTGLPTHIQDLQRIAGE